MTSHLFDYLESFSKRKMHRLYEQPSAALAIFRRMLPHLAKSFVMAILFMKEPILEKDVHLWVRSKSTKQMDGALSIMRILHILEDVRVETETHRRKGFELAEAFAKSLRHALTGGGDHRSFGVPCTIPDTEPVSVAFLDDYARSKWEGVLGYMVGSSGVAGLGQDAIMVDTGVRNILESGDLVKMSHGRPQITKEGFAFVLQETNTQVWKILLLYVQAVEINEQLNMEPVEALSFIFLLSSLELGQSYSTSALTPTQTRMLEDLHEFGIIYQPSHDSSRFYPTRLATTLTSDSGALANSITGSASETDPSLASSAENGFIIIETNFRLYAYTFSPLQIAVLSLFCRLNSKYPNLVTGLMTRNSMRRAIRKGITSAQIISYLATHAHPQMRKRNAAQAAQSISLNPSADAATGILPPTVIDTIQLWQLEDERMSTTEGFLFRDFDTKADYERPCRYAETLGVLVWKNDKKGMFFVWKEKEVVAFIQQRQNQSHGD